MQRACEWEGIEAGRAASVGRPGHSDLSNGVEPIPDDRLYAQVTIHPMLTWRSRRS